MKIMKRNVGVFAVICCLLLGVIVAFALQSQAAPVAYAQESSGAAIEDNISSAHNMIDTIEAELQEKGIRA